MKTLHAIILLMGSAFTVAGIYLKLDDPESDLGGFIRGLGIGILIAFTIIFYKHLKTKNETTSK